MADQLVETAEHIATVCADLAKRCGDVGAASADDLVAAVGAVESSRTALDAARLTLVGEIDARGESLRRSGLRTSSWLGHEFGLSRPAAGRAVAVARKLRSVLPKVADALAAGRITFEHAALLARLATPRVEAVLVELQDTLVELADGVRFERWARDVRALIELADQDGAHQPEGPADRLRLHWDHDGTLHLDGTLTGTAANTVAHHLGHAAQACFRRTSQDAHVTAGELPRTRADHLAEALVDLVRRGSAAGSPSSPATDLTVTIPVDHPALAGTSGGPTLFDRHGNPVGPTTLDLLCCDPTITALIVDSLGTPLDLGSAVRFAQPHQRRALAVRDGGCVFPGCDAPPSWTDAHHPVRPADGGGTDLDNLALLCRHHHGVVHSTGWQMRHVGDQHFEIVTPRGAVLACQRHQRPAPGPVP